MKTPVSQRMTAIVIVLLVIAQHLALAGTTGKLAGRILDAKKEPLPNVNILINGTTLGGVTDLDGYYAVLNIPPGRYTVQYRLVGYRSYIANGIDISVDNTKKLDVTLEDESITTDAVVVTAQKPVVDIGLTSTVATISDNDIKKLPVQSLSDIVNLQAGVVEAGGQSHFRGGRAGEVQYQVNGVSVNNAFDNSSTVQIDRSLIQEVQVITGTFDAEYGQAMSGVVNTVLKSGSEEFEVNGEILGGSFVYGSGDKRGLDYTFRPATTQNFQVSLSGPTGLPQTYFLLNAQRYVFNDYFYGNRTFVPTDTSNLELNIPHATGDGASVPMSWSKQWSGLAKIANRSIPGVELSYQAIFNVIQAQKLDGAFAWRMNPDGRTTQNTKSLVHGIDWTQTVSPSTFYTISLRQNYFDYTDWAYDNFYDPRYDADGAPKSLNLLSYYGAIVQGVDFGRYRQRTNTYLAQGSITSQVTRSHQIKIGGEFQTTKLEFGAAGTLVLQDIGGQQALVRYVDAPPSYPGVQVFKPVSAAAFAQDMIEWNDLTIRAGLRFEYFNARSTVPSDPANPANAIPGAPPSYDKRTTMKVSIAPRLGISYPITERSSVFFSYGHFYQLPNLGDMFSNDNYARLALLQAGASDYTYVGNPDVKPEKTVQYEFGYKNAVTDFLGVSVNLFYKDIRDLLGVEFINTYTGAQYSRLNNIDFGNVTGFTISLDQRRIGIFSSTLDYTWQMAQGNSSDPQERANLAQAGFDPRPQSVPFNWDQRHTLNVTLQLSQPDNYSVSTVMRYASGQPYTPSLGSGFGSQIERNSGSKPTGFLMDLRLEKYYKIGKWELSVFARVFNLLNTDFFNGFVYSNTGSPDYSLTPTADRNSLIDPTRYYPPRRIEIGVTLNSIL